MADEKQKLSGMQKIFGFLKDNAKYAMGPVGWLAKAGYEAAAKKDLSTASKIAKVASKVCYNMTADY